MAAQNKRWLWVIPLVILLLAAYYLSPVSMAFNDQGLTILPSIFGYLVLISMFVERAIEVFLSAWRSRGADELDHQIAIAKRKLDDYLKTAEDKAKLIQNETYSQLHTALESAETKRRNYKSESRYISQWLGLAMGVLLSFVGVRVLENLLIIGPLEGFQKSAFVAVDVMLTGVAIAGGSDSINKMMKVYSSFMESTAQRTQAQS